MNNILVCHITSAHPPNDVRIFNKECQSIANAGYHVSLIVPGAKSKGKENVQIIGLSPSKGGRLLRMTVTVMKLLQAAIRVNANIYHLHDPELMIAGICIKLATGRKVIYDVHEDYAKQILSKSYIPKIARRFIAFLVKTVEYFACKSFDGVVVATDDILINFKHHKNALSVKNFPIVDNYRDCEVHQEKKTDIFYLIYIGVVAEIRGITETIKALELIDPNKPVKLTLCGRIYPPDYKNEIQELAAYSKVDYRGQVEPNKIPEMLKSSDAGLVCLHPLINYLDSLPVKLFEYMASGLPAIASNFPLWKEIILENKCGVCVDPLNPSEIASAIEYLIDNPQFRKEMGKNGQKAVIDKYNWKNESKKLLHLYKKILTQ